MLNQLNDVPKILWLVLMAIGFIWFWPIGLAVLAWLVWSGRLGQRINLSFGPLGASFWSTGNKAFDQHRDDVVAKLRDEEKAFSKFVNDLAAAKDKGEFDQFMATRK